MFSVSSIFASGHCGGEHEGRKHHEDHHGGGEWHESSYRRHYSYRGEDRYGRHDREGLLEGLGDIL